MYKDTPENRRRLRRSIDAAWLRTVSSSSDNAWINGSKALSSLRARVDIHKYILEDILVLNPQSLSEQIRGKLIKLCHDVHLEPFPTLELQFTNGYEPRKMIDLCILEALGFNDEETALLLEQLYKAIRNQFDTLRELSS